MMIREATEDDVSDIVTMWQMMDEHVANVTQKYLLKSKEDEYIDVIKQFVLEIMNDNKCVIFVATRKSNIRGFITGHIEKLPWFKPSTGLIGSLWVNEIERNKGVGSQLLKYAENWLNKREILNIQVCWDKENEMANKFWQSKGYSVSQLRGSKQSQ